MSKKEENYNSLVIEVKLFIKKNKPYFSSIYLKILQILILFLLFLITITSFLLYYVIITILICFV